MTLEHSAAREISKPRLIAALFAELDASSAIVMAESQTDGRIYQGILQCEFKVPFQNSQIIFSAGNAEGEELNCICCTGGQRISFFLKRLEGNRWVLPAKVSLVELRRNRRLAFANRSYSAELVTSRGALYGYAVDINRDFLAVDIDPRLSIAIEENVRVLIRMVNTNVDVFYNNCTLVQAKETEDGQKRLILKRESLGSNHAVKRKFVRHPVQGADLEISKGPFADDFGRLSLPILSASNGGLTVSLRRGEFGAEMVPGLILETSSREISYMVVWVEGHMMGLRPLVTASQQLVAWYQFLDRILPRETEKGGVTRRELAQLLTHSGLLKGSRRRPFGDNASEHLISTAAESSLVSQRCVLADREGFAGLHISWKRVSENSWLFTEGAALIDNAGDYNRMMDACTQKVAYLAKESRLYPRYLTSTFTAAVKSTGVWAERLAAQEGSVMLESLHCSISALLEDCGAGSGPVRLEGVPTLKSSDRRIISNSFSPLVYEAIVGGDGNHPILNSELGKYGPYHRALSKFAYFCADRAVIAHRIITHSAWSSTGVTNSVFVFVPEGVASEDLKSCLAAIGRDEIAYGTDDFLITFDGPGSPSGIYVAVLPHPKPFSFLIHDLYLNQDAQSIDDAGASNRAQSARAVAS